MKAVRFRFVLSFLVVTAAAGLFAATPLWACHEATGWCCVGEDENGHPWCCNFIDDEIDLESCGYK